MSGKRKAARRRARQNYTIGERVFQEHEVMGTGACFDQLDGTPGLMFMMSVCADRVAGILEQTARFEIVHGECIAALDAVIEDGSRRRVFTDVRQELLLQLRHTSDGVAKELQVFLAELVPETRDGIRRPLVIRRVDDERLMREPVFVGEGKYVITTLNIWSGGVFAQWCETQEEADAQLQRNIEADLPFAGMAMN